MWTVLLGPRPSELERLKEVGIVDPALGSVEWFVRDDAGYRPADRSTLLDISAPELVQVIDWPE